MPKIRHASTAVMYPHPLLERVGMMSGLATHFTAKAKKAGKNREDHRELAEELEGDWQTFVTSVKADGVLEPLKICKVPVDVASVGYPHQFWIVDGRNRWTGAKEAGLKRVPYILVHPDDASAIIMATVTGRRHYTKGATAYLACLMHPEFAVENTRGPKARTEDANSALSAETLAARFSISPRVLEQAAELFRLVEANPAFRVDAEADVWAGVGLGGILAGIKSLIATGLRPGDQDADRKRAMAAWTFTNKGCKQLGSAWERWGSLGTDQRKLAVDALTETLKAAPEDVKLILKSLA